MGEGPLVGADVVEDAVEEEEDEEDEDEKEDDVADAFGSGVSVTDFEGLVMSGWTLYSIQRSIRTSSCSSSVKPGPRQPRHRSR